MEERCSLFSSWGRIQYSGFTEIHIYTYNNVQLVRLGH